MQGNVNGKLGKVQLDVNRINSISKASFELYPLTINGNEKKEWAECTKAIDEVGRKLNQKYRKKTV